MSPSQKNATPAGTNYCVKGSFAREVPTMLLEARAASCFSTTFLLKLEGRPLGTFEGRWFSESLDVSLLERHRLQFQKNGWMGSQFVLEELPERQPLGRANRGGVFTSSWDLEVSTGPGRLDREGWFATGYVFRQGARDMARVDRLGVCERGWVVEGAGALRPEDLLLIGLVFHVIQQRAAQHAAASHAGS
jgi:hypothetical protein